MNNHNLFYEILSLSKFYFVMFLGIVKYDNEFETKEILSMNIIHLMYGPEGNS